MKTTNMENNELREIIRKLLSELDWAYQGIRTLPADHRAKVVYVAAMNLLVKP